MGWYRKLRNLTRRDRINRDIDRELSFHMKERIGEFMASGMTETEARQRAARQFGNYGLQLERVRDMDVHVWLEAIAKDVKYSIRGLWKSPGFTLAAVGILALGIGASTAIFSVVNAFLIRPLPYPEPERLVALFERNVFESNEPPAGISVGIGSFLDWQKTARSFEQMAAISFRTVTLSSTGNDVAPERLTVCNCSGNLFATLGIKPALGRAFLPDEDRFQAARVAAISYPLWQTTYGGSPNIIGKPIRLDGDEYEVVAVMPRGFMFPNSQVQVWRPLLTSMPPQQQIRRDLHNHNIVARLRPGVSIAEAFSELDGIAARYKQSHPDESVGRGANVIPLHGFFVFNAQRPLIILLGAVGCLLLIACVNIASLVLSRATSRTREISIRAALGAGRGGIIRQLVTESVILALAGGALGAISAVSITDFLASKAPGAVQIVSSEGIPVDPVVFLFAFGIAVLSGVGVGLYPAIRASRTDLANDLKSGGRPATATRAHARLRSVLVATELAFSVVLVMGAGLLLRSFFVLYQVQPGMRVEQTLTMDVSIPVASYRSPAQRASLLSQIAERVRTIPGVRSAGITSCAPLSGVCNFLFYYVDGRPFVSGKFLTAPEQAVDPEYFASAGIPLLQGRTFKAEDGIGFDLNNPRPGSVVISESLARTVFPGEDPIGKRIFFDFEVQRGKIQGTPVPRYEVIGVVGDVLSTLDAKPAAMLYRPLLGMGNTLATVLLHTAVEPKSVIGVARDTLRRMDPGLAVSRVRTGEETLSSSTSNRQFNMLLLGTFAGLALLLAAIGLYGLVSHMVSQRQTEIGIRLALGATRQQVNRLVLLQGLKPAMTGVVLGIVGSGFAAPILRAQLFGITPMDLWTFATVPVLLLAIAVLACCLPARRASRLDPTTALRSE